MKKGLISAMGLVALMALLTVGCAPAPTAPTSTSATPSTRPEAFFLEVSEPQDESVVSVGDIRLSGATTPDAVVSVNGEIVEVNEDGNFTTMVTLEEGPNLIEVVASDFEGNEDSCILTIVYVP